MTGIDANTALMGGLVGVVGLLIVLYLRSIKLYLQTFAERMDRQDDQIKRHEQKIAAAAEGVGEIRTRLAECKTDCERSFVSSEAFLRETGFARRTMEGVTKSLASLEGKTTVVVDKMPQIAGDIARQIVRQMKGDPNG